jgi:hypothetical protein
MYRLRPTDRTTRRKNNRTLMDLDFDYLDLETVRTYHFGNGLTTTVENVKRIAVVDTRLGLVHKLVTASGIKIVIPTGWVALEIITDEPWMWPTEDSQFGDLA